MRKKLVSLLLLGLVALSAFSQNGDTSVETVEWGGLTRSYRLHVPPERAEHPALLVVLHGGGGRAAQMERYTRFSRLADEQGFIVVYPEGYEKGWNDGRAGEFNAATRENIDDVGFIREVVEHTARHYQVDRRRIFATGISNGGFMSSRLGAEAADLFCAIAPVVGGIPKSWSEKMQLARPLSVLIIQGTDDPLVPYAGGYVQVGRQRRGEMLSTDAALAKWRELNACSPDGRTEAIPDRDPKDGCRATRTRYSGPNSEVTLIKVEGGGHTWPGAAPYLPRAVVGPVCRDFDATQEIWSFFLGRVDN